MKPLFAFSALLLTLATGPASAAVLLSLYPDNNLSSLPPLVLSGQNGQTKYVGFKVENDGPEYILFNSLSSNASLAWTDVFTSSVINVSGGLNPLGSISGSWNGGANFPGFGSYTFPLLGSGVSETVNFVLNYSSYTEDPNGPNAGDGYLGDFEVSASIRFDFEPSTEPPGNVIPEPSSLLLIGSSAFALYGLRRRMSL